jgi:uncharacterized protein (TIGR00251 family)
MPSDRLPISETSHGVVLSVSVVPRAGKTGFERMDDRVVRIRVAAPPVDGAANEALLRFLADECELPRSRLRLIGGERGRRKRVLISGIDAASLGEVLLRLIPSAP